MEIPTWTLPSGLIQLAMCKFNILAANWERGELPWSEEDTMVSCIQLTLQNANVVMLGLHTIFHFCESNTRFLPKATSKPF